MHVKFQQSGGFAGLLRGCEFDTTELPAKEQVLFRRLLQQTPISRQSKSKSQQTRDAIRYEISFEDNGEKRVITADDSTLNEELAALIEFLQSKARPLTLR